MHRFKEKLLHMWRVAESYDLRWKGVSLLRLIALLLLVWIAVGALWALLLMFTVITPFDRVVVHTGKVQSSREEVSSARVLVSSYDTSNWKIYRNRKYGFLIQYPSLWRASGKVTSEEFVEFIGDDPESRERVTFRVFVRGDEAVQDLNSFVEDIARLESRGDGRKDNIRVVGREHIMTGTIPGVLREEYWTRVDSRVLRTFLLHDGTVFEISFLVSGSDAGSVQKLYEAVLATFRAGSEITEEEKIQRLFPSPQIAYTPPYPFSWDDQGVHFDMTGISLGILYPPQGFRNPAGGNYRGDESVRMMVFRLTMQTTPQFRTGCITPPILRLLDEEGHMASPSTPQFTLHASGGCVAIERETYENEEIAFVIPESEELFTFTTGGTSNIFFTVKAPRGGRVEVAPIPLGDG